MRDRPAGSPCGHQTRSCSRASDRYRGPERRREPPSHQARPSRPGMHTMRIASTSCTWYTGEPHSAAALISTRLLSEQAGRLARVGLQQRAVVVAVRGQQRVAQTRLVSSTTSGMGVSAAVWPRAASCRNVSRTCQAKSDLPVPAAPWRGTCAVSTGRYVVDRQPSPGGR
jgi:hypothetical protein